MNILPQIRKFFFNRKPKIIVVLGQTAIGKSNLAVEIAQKYNGEIISADSRQVYKSMDLGSGKITKDEMKNITHHLLDVINPEETFDVKQFQKLGTLAIQNILKKKKLPIICGGTGFYIDSLIYQTKFSSVKPNEELRNELEKKSLGELQCLLKDALNNNTSGSLISYFQNSLRSLRKYAFWDDKGVYKIDMKNPIRIIRALEIIEELGYIPRAKKRDVYKVLYVGLTIPKEDLDKRIYNRIIARLEQGMLDETYELLKNGVSHERLQSLGLEYRFMSKHILGEINHEEMVNQLYSAIVRFSKRQKTWFKRNKKIHWFNPLKYEKDVFDLIDKFL